MQDLLGLRRLPTLETVKAFDPAAVLCCGTLYLLILETIHAVRTKLQ